MKMLKVAGILFVVVCMAWSVNAEETTRTVKIMSITGGADVRLTGQGEWITAEEGMILNQGDVIKTGPDSWVLLNVNGSGETATVEVNSSSQLLMAQLLKDTEKGTEHTLLDLAIGEIMITVEKIHSAKSTFDVKTPTSTIGVRGTKFAVKVDALD
ncbi:MAG: FecR domain-containing protein [Candidatus Omnitrophica bacterium]|nr:FecR domain-containing protein [Candidatus Omnitrophota bacterium]